MASFPLPVEVWQSVILFLPPIDVLSVLCVNRACSSLGRTGAFWKRLFLRDNEEDAIMLQDDESCDVLHRAYLTHAYKNALSSVRWYPIRSDRVRISEREGHLACMIKSSSQKRRIVITGGFSDDETVYVLDPGKSWNHRSGYWTMNSVRPSQSAEFVYGASLTPLEGLCNDGDDDMTFRAIRFGGFRGGGYSHETNQLSLLSIRQVEGGQPTARWEEIQPTNPQLAMPRAYHTATLLNGRYLLIIGGMMWRESILAECILDTQTWTWIDTTITTGLKAPKGRHGHSIVLDSKRNRLVLFGGGNGTDLLRSGYDDYEVWELQLGHGWQDDLLQSLPWKWNPIYCSNLDTVVDPNGDEQLDGASDDSHNTEGEAHRHQQQHQQHDLSPAENLCLGRCHSNFKISADRVLLLFGSGAPSTNGLIAFDLKDNVFHRPAITGIIPKPRFTGVAVGLEEGYILTHGGYCTQESDAIGEWDVLDVAPALKRGFGSLPIDNTREPHEVITDAQAQAGRSNSGQAAMIELMYRTLLRQVHRFHEQDDNDDDDDDDDDDDIDYDDDDSYDPGYEEVE
ncbi:galactose oxidase [Nitzschia inconspicua]|uniref:Galactose oxidase n=1 Tax=Nitzschia inconspicua TaxID=303405 RepID=A0A9K3LT84_9STRA|nr:galactose oxidase [Nitzschia inconspicua]